MTSPTSLWKRTINQQKQNNEKTSRWIIQIIGCNSSTSKDVACPTHLHPVCWHWNPQTPNGHSKFFHVNLAGCVFTCIIITFKSVIDLEILWFQDWIFWAPNIINNFFMYRHQQWIRCMAWYRGISGWVLKRGPWSILIKDYPTKNTTIDTPWFHEFPWSSPKSLYSFWC